MHLIVNVLLKPIRRPSYLWTEHEYWQFLALSTTMTVYYKFQSSDRDTFITLRLFNWRQAIYKYQLRKWWSFVDSLSTYRLINYSLFRIVHILQSADAASVRRDATSKSGTCPYTLILTYLSAPDSRKYGHSGMILLIAVIALSPYFNEWADHTTHSHAGRLNITENIKTEIISNNRIISFNIINIAFIYSYTIISTKISNTSLDVNHKMSSAKSLSCSSGFT